VSTGLRSHVKLKPLIPALEEIVQLQKRHWPVCIVNQVCFTAAIRAVCRPNEEPTLQANDIAFPEESVRKYLLNTMKYKTSDSQNLNANMRATAAVNILTFFEFQRVNVLELQLPDPFKPKDLDCKKNKNKSLTSLGDTHLLKGNVQYRRTG
jgi:hypothetical protein